MANPRNFTTADQYIILRMLEVPHDQVPIWEHNACELIERVLNKAFPPHLSQSMIVARRRQQEDDALVAQRLQQEEDDTLVAQRLHQQEEDDALVAQRLHQQEEDYALFAQQLHQENLL